ncbi:MAG: amino acid ABC transporter permease [Anaerolineae bacterium]|nr:amino acid ABC transporter permease [Anaerolineae bacterium]
MLNETFRFVGHRLSASERWHWRFLVGLAGVLIVLVGYSLPMFSNRISAAVTRYSGGTITVKTFPELVREQYLLQGQHPTGEEFSDVSIRIEPVPPMRSSGWGWLIRIARSSSVGRLLSFVICLALPLICASFVSVMIARAWCSENGLPERMIPPSITLSWLSIPALVLAWFHQFDFSSLLLAKGGQALLPRAGFWVALGGLIVVAVAVFGLWRETRRALASWWALVLAVILAIWLLTRFKPYPFLVIWNFVFDGILVTLRISATSFGFILLVSLLGGLGRISRSPIIYGLSSLYVEIVRGIPLLVQLLFIWFALPQVFDVIGEALMSLSPALGDIGQRLIDLRMSPFAAAVAGLTFCYGAYGSEIFRAGISSIHHGQMEAARSLGMTYLQAMRYIILPQAIRVILPPVGNEFVALLKDSSLVSVLAVSDLTRRGREYMARTFQSFDTWILVALCYLVLTLFSSRAVEFIESKTKIGR